MGEYVSNDDLLGKTPSGKRSQNLRWKNRLGRTNPDKRMMQLWEEDQDNAVSGGLHTQAGLSSEKQEETAQELVLPGFGLDAADRAGDRILELQKANKRYQEIPTENTEESSK